MASVTVNSSGKVTSVKNGKKSNTSLSDNYTSTSDGYKKISTSTPVGANTTTETPYTGTNVSASTPVIGSMDGTTSSTGASSTNGISYNPTDNYISGLGNSIPYDDDNPSGYAARDGLNGSTYNTRQTAYTFSDDDGQHTVYSNYTNYKDAMNAAIASGEISPNATFQSASTYGTASLGTSEGRNYGGTVGGNGYAGFGADAYISDDQYSNMYDQNNMQLSYLSGKYGHDYSNPYASSANSDSLNNAYLKGIENYGTGLSNSAYSIDQSGLSNSALTNYGGLTYQGLTASDIQNSMNDIMSNYADSVNNYNDALAAGYDYQMQQNKQDTEDNQRALYIQKAIAEKNLPKQLAAQGISGGLTESTLAGINSDYQNNYNENQKALLQANTQIQVAKEQALAESNMNLATQLASLQQQTISMVQSAADAENSFNLALAQMQQSQSNADREYALSVAQANLDKAKNDYDQTIENATIAYNAGDYNTYAEIISQLDGFEDFDTTYLQQQQALTALENQVKTASYNSSLATYQKKTTNVGSSSSGSSSSRSSSNSSLDSSTSTPLSSYASGLYTDLVKSGYLTTQIDDKITQEYQKGYITKNEADTLAKQLLGV